jgi:hypothetical protein
MIILSRIHDLLSSKVGKIGRLATRQQDAEDDRPTSNAQVGKVGTRNSDGHETLSFERG